MRASIMFRFSKGIDIGEQHGVHRSKSKALTQPIPIRHCILTQRSRNSNLGTPKWYKERHNQQHCRNISQRFTLLQPYTHTVPRCNRIILPFDTGIGKGTCHNIPWSVVEQDHHSLLAVDILEQIQNAQAQRSHECNLHLVASQYSHVIGVAMSATCKLFKSKMHRAQPMCK